MTTPRRDHLLQDFYTQLYENASQQDRFAPLWRQRANEAGGAAIRLRTLQNMNIIHLRKLLADEVGIMVQSKSTNHDQMEHVGSLMSRYVSAARDIKFILEKQSENDLIDKFLHDLMYIKAQDKSAILHASGLIKADSRIPVKPIHIPNFSGHHGYRNTEATRQEKLLRFFRRLATALFGGLALIVPMLIMRLVPTLLTQLLTASLFILAVGCFLAFFLENADEAYIAQSVSAAYAAVLVVFVGASSSS